MYLNSIFQKLRAHKVARTQNTAQQDFQASSAQCVQTMCRNDFCLWQRTLPTRTF